MNSRTALPIFRILRRTGNAWLACALALAWTVHPLTTAAVTYLSQRTELLMATGYLLTLYAFIRANESRQTGWWILGYLLTTGLSQRSVGFGLGISPLRYAFTEGAAVLLNLKLALWPSPLIRLPPFACPKARLPGSGCSGVRRHAAARRVASPGGPRQRLAGRLGAGRFWLPGFENPWSPVAPPPAGNFLPLIFLPKGLVVCAQSFCGQLPWLKTANPPIWMAEKSAKGSGMPPDVCVAAPEQT